MMTDAEGGELRAAIRRALEAQDYEGDIGFVSVADLPPDRAREIGAFAVLELPCGENAVTIPGDWEDLPYIRDVLQAMANQEVSRFLGRQPD